VSFILAKAQPGHIGPDLFFQAGGFCKLGIEFDGEAAHFGFEGFGVLIGFGGHAHIASRGEHIALGRDLRGGDGFAEAGEVLIWIPARVGMTGIGVTSPGVVAGGDPDHFLVGELAVDPVSHHAQRAGVDEEGVAAAVAQLAVGLVAGEEPQAGRDAGGIEELIRQGHNAIHQVRFDTADGEVHFCQAPGGGVGFLAVDADVVAPAAVGFDE